MLVSKAAPKLHNGQSKMLPCKHDGWPEFESPKSQEKKWLSGGGGHVILVNSVLEVQRQDWVPSSERDYLQNKIERGCAIYQSLTSLYMHAQGHMYPYIHILPYTQTYTHTNTLRRCLINFPSMCCDLTVGKERESIRRSHILRTD